MALVFQADRLATGPPDAGLGYGQIPSTPTGFKQSLAFEYDLVNDPGVDDATDCPAPHISAHTMGEQTNSAVESVASKYCWKFVSDEYTRVHNINVTYSAKLLSVYTDSIGQPIMQIPTDLTTALGLKNALAWVGVTASTGADGGDEHTVSDIVYTYYSDLAPSKSTVAGLDNTNAGQLQTVTIVSVDEFGHPYPFGGANITAAMKSAQPSTQFNYVWNDLRNGNYTLQWSSTLATNDQLTIAINDVPIFGSPFAVTIEPLQVDPASCNTSGSTTYAQAGQVTDFQVIVRDKYGNPTPDNVTFDGTTLSGDPGSITISNLDDPVNVGLGVWGMQFTPQTVGQYAWNILVNGAPIGDQPPPLHVALGPPDASKCIVFGLPSNGHFPVGDTQSFVLTLYDGSGNLYSGNASVTFQLATSDNVNPPITAPVTASSDIEGHYNCSFDVTAARTWTLNITILGKPVTQGVPASLVSDPGPVAPSACSITSYHAGQPTPQFVAGTQISTSLAAVDQFNNPIPTTDIPWAVSLNPVVTASAPTQNSPPSAGLWTVVWQPLTATTYTMTVTIGGTPIMYSGQYQVVVTALTTPNVTTSQVSGVGASTATVGRKAIFWVVVKDSFGNVIPNGPTSQVTCQIVANVPNPQPSDSIPTTVTYVATNSSWTVEYTPTVGGPFKLVLNLGNNPWRGGTAIINVTGGGGLGPGIIAAIVLGCLGGVALIVGIVFLVLRRKKKYQSI